LNIKEDILKNVSNQMVSVAIDFHIGRRIQYNGGQWLPSTVWLPTFF